MIVTTQQELTVAEKFLLGVRIGRQIEINATGCWTFTGSLDGSGYAKISVANRSVIGHRLTWELASGCAVPEGLDLDHLRRNRACVNPNHLEPVTRGENTRRIPSRTHCKQGHEFTAENTLPASGGGRRCRACNRIASKARRMRIEVSA